MCAFAMYQLNLLVVVGTQVAVTHDCYLYDNCPQATPPSNCHIFQLTPPIKVVLSIIEPGCHKILIVDGPYPRDSSSPWVGGVLNARGPHSYQDRFGPLTNGATSLRHGNEPFVFWALLMERCTTCIYVVCYLDQLII